MMLDKCPQTPSSVPSSTGERAKSADISFNSSSFTHVKLAPEIPIVGFKNELYFCYMNATLQVLLSMMELNEFFLNQL